VRTYRCLSASGNCLDPDVRIGDFAATTAAYAMRASGKEFA
jgi:hypothetical protein